MEGGNESGGESNRSDADRDLATMISYLIRRYILFTQYDLLSTVFPYHIKHQNYDIDEVIKPVRMFQLL